MFFPSKRTGHVEKYPKDAHVSTGRPIATQRKRPLAGETGGVQLPPRAVFNRFLVECGFDLGCIGNATPIETIDCYAFSLFVSNSETTQSDEVRPSISMSTTIRSDLLFIIRLRFSPISVGKTYASQSCEIYPLNVFLSQSPAVEKSTAHISRHPRPPILSQVHSSIPRAIAGHLGHAVRSLDEVTACGVDG